MCFSYVMHLSVWPASTFYLSFRLISPPYLKRFWSSFWTLRLSLRMRFEFEWCHIWTPGWYAWQRYCKSKIFTIESLGFLLHLKYHLYVHHQNAVHEHNAETNHVIKFWQRLRQCRLQLLRLVTFYLLVLQIYPHIYKTLIWREVAFLTLWSLLLRTKSLPKLLKILDIYVWKSFIEARFWNCRFITHCTIIQTQYDQFIS